MDTLSYNTRSTLIRIVATSGWQAICALGRRGTGHTSTDRNRDNASTQASFTRRSASSMAARLGLGRR
ncbi:hypothetical protein [Frateuria aurantia]|uniref:Uncharacterized protein n=1 Tax=Frateuria aurantia (strain ATCC 33424 / DSM 6220 / KCTC 2777 / LMG 1558 / NBRC 3245 / NCIMB 13370) TaxID=767434 RepID=H8L1Q8_FRAAD|nr:hypothetical protein [Frateuria aurantia]AFC85418.1 hypothetical protein Fraau_0949 [Frateuria aurantia DSM 6220]